MNLEQRYRDYYTELFKVHSGELFYYLVGDNYDEYGDEYNDKYEDTYYSIFAEDFGNILTLVTMGNVPITVDMIKLKLVEYMSTLMKAERELGNSLILKGEGLNTLAKLIQSGIDRRIGMNNVNHPLRGEKVTVSAEVKNVKGVAKPYYVLFQEDGYYAEEVNSRVIGVSSSESKLKAFCDKRIDSILKSERYKGFTERNDLVNSYRQLVSNSRGLRLTWRIEEVEGVV